MDTFFINQTMLKSLTDAAESIRNDKNLVSQDMPVLAAQAAALQGAVAAQMATCAQSQQPQLSPEMDELLTVEQAAEKLQFSRGHLYALIRMGKFPANKLGKRSYRVRKSDIANWNYQDAHREPAQSFESKSRFQNNSSSSRKSPESYEKRVRGPRQRQSVN
jgi:excisionase family DNA binding protein